MTAQSPCHNPITAGQGPTTRVSRGPPAALILLSLPPMWPCSLNTGPPRCLLSPRDVFSTVIAKPA